MCELRGNKGKMQDGAESSGDIIAREALAHDMGKRAEAASHIGLFGCFVFGWE